MSNPLFQATQGSLPENNIMAQVAQLKQTFRGDPTQQIQQMLNSGKVTQAQYNHAVQRAQQIMRMLGR